jgi:hypothetical protein
MVGGTVVDDAPGCEDVGVCTDVVICFVDELEVVEAGFEELVGLDVD